MIPPNHRFAQHHHFLHASIDHQNIIKYHYNLSTTIIIKCNIATHPSTLNTVLPYDSNHNNNNNKDNNDKSNINILGLVISLVTPY